MKKVVSVFLMLILITGVFPAAPAQGAAEAVFEVTLSADSVPGSIVYSYDGSGALTDTSGELQVPVGYDGNIQVAITTTTGEPGTVIASGTLGVAGAAPEDRGDIYYSVNDNVWTGGTSYQSGSNYTAILSLSPDYGAAEISLTIPALTEFHWFTGIKVNGQSAEREGEDYSYAAKATQATGNEIELTGVPAGVECNESVGEGFTRVEGEELKWTLDFPGSPLATGSFYLQYGGLSQTVDLTVNYDFQLQVKIDGQTMASDDQSYNFSYEATVTGTGPHEIMVKAGDGVDISPTELDSSFTPEADAAGWKRWTLNFADDQLDARLQLTLQSGEINNSAQIYISRDPQLVTGVTVDGQAAAGGFKGVYTYTAMPAGTGTHQVVINTADGVDCTASETQGFVMGNDWKTWTVDFSELETTYANLYLELEKDGMSVSLNIEIDRDPQYVTGLTVNGTSYSFAVSRDEAAYHYDASLSVDQLTGNQIEISGGDDVGYTNYTSDPAGAFAMAGTWRTWTLNRTGEGTATLSITLKNDESGAVAQVRIQIDCRYVDPQLVSGLTVNGTTYAFAWHKDGLNYYNTSLRVDQLTGNQISINGGENVTYGDHASDPGAAFVMEQDNWRAWILNMTKEGTATLTITLLQDNEPAAQVRIVIDCQSPQVPGGGVIIGGGGAVVPAEKPNVTNQTNQPNGSSDTILVPQNTQEAGGQSVTAVTSAEIDALLNLAEAHSGDVADGENQAIINIADQTPGGNTTYEVNLNSDDVGRIANSSIDVLAVQTGISQFRIRSEALGGLGTATSEPVQIKLSKVDHDGRPGIDASVAVGEKIVSNFNGVYSVEIRIPYKLQPGEDPSALCIEYLREDGTTELVTESRYNPDTETVSFFPPHLSKYGVSYRPVLFSDVAPNHWASGYITFLAARDVITNPQGTRFRPDDAITRAEFINMAARAFSVSSLGKRGFQSYRDVSPNAWYALAVGWSYMNNISPVLSSGGNFYPERRLDREEMATLINNVSLSVGLRLRTESPAVSFSDAKTISAYAWNAVARMATCGIVPEAGGGRFLPKNNCTRAEAARSISLMMAKMR